MNRDKFTLMIGDILAIAVVTVVGFVTHGEGSLEFLPRMATAFFPLAIAWLILAPWFELFDLQPVFNLKIAGRIALAVSFAAPLALIFRGLLLNAPIIPIFAVVFTLTSTFGLMVWRAIYFLFTRK